MEERINTTATPERRSVRRLLPGVAGASAVAFGLLAGFAGAAGAQDHDCVRYVLEDDYGSSFWTFGDYDRWILDAGGDSFTFDNPAEGAVLTVGNGMDIVAVTKCTSPPPAAPEATSPTTVPAAEPAPEPVAVSTPEPVAATPEPTPEPVAATRTEPTPEKTVKTRTEPTPEPVIEGRVEWSADEPTTPADATLEETVTDPSPETTGSSPQPGTPEPTAPDSSIAVEATPEPAIPATPAELFTPLAPLFPTTPFIVGDAEVLGVELARTGPQDVALAATVGAALCALGFALMGLGRRRARHS